MSGYGITGCLIWTFVLNSNLVSIRFLVSHGLEGKDLSDDQYGINHCFVGGF